MTLNNDRQNATEIVNIVDRSVSQVVVIVNIVMIISMSSCRDINHLKVFVVPTPRVHRTQNEPQRIRC